MTSAIIRLLPKNYNIAEKKLALLAIDYLMLKIAISLNPYVILGFFWRSNIPIRQE